jgi:hypothetical protein
LARTAIIVLVLDLPVFRWQRTASLLVMYCLFAGNVLILCWQCIPAFIVCVIPTGFPLAVYCFFNGNVLFSLFECITNWFTRWQFTASFAGNEYIYHFLKSMRLVS